MTRHMTVALVLLAILAWAGIVTTQVQIAITSSMGDVTKADVHAGRTH